MEKDRKETPVSPILGKQSVSLQKPVYMIDSASIVGKKEGEGPLGDLFDLVGEDDMFGAQTWEDAESTLQKEALGTALRKAGWRAPGGTLPVCRGSAGTGNRHQLRPGEL